MNLKATLRLLPLFWVVACSTLRNEIVYQSEDLEVFQYSALSMGINLERSDYMAALERWPWIRGAQLHRRALLLKTGLTPDALSKLDNNTDANLELRYLDRIKPSGQSLKTQHHLSAL